MFPPLPTDNLYKFIALSGLVVALYCGWMYWSAVKTIVQEEPRVRHQYIAIVGDLSSEFGAYTSKKEDQIRYHLFLGKGGEGDDTELIIDEIKPGLSLPYFHDDEMRQQHRERIAKIDFFLASALAFRGNHEIVSDTGKLIAYRERLREHSESVEQFWHFLNQTYMTMAFEAAVFPVSILVMVYGFASWYYKYQRHQNEIIKLQLEKARKDLAG